MNNFLLRLRSLFRAATLDSDMDDEVTYHIEKQTAEYVRQGLPEHEAAILARRQFGNATLHKEECRDTRNVAWLENVVQDFRHSLRSLRRSPGFTVVSIATLAVGIGATTALFAVLDAALLHPLSAREPQRLIWLQEFSAEQRESGGNPPRLADWQKAHSFSAMGGFYSENAIWASAQGPLQLVVLRTLGDLGGALEISMRLGRPFSPSEDRGEGPPVALLTDKGFRQRFHSDAGVLNQTIRLGGAAYQVIGVLIRKPIIPKTLTCGHRHPPALRKPPGRQAFSTS